MFSSVNTSFAVPTDIICPFFISTILSAKAPARFRSLLVNEGKTDEAREVLKVIDKKLKKAEQRNLFHKNKVARKMSRLTHKLNKAV